MESQLFRVKVDGEDLCQWRKREYWSDIVGETIDVGGGVAEEILGVPITVVAAVTDVDVGVFVCLEKCRGIKDWD